MIRTATLCLYERWLEAPPTPVALPAGVVVQILRAPATTAFAGPAHPRAEHRLQEGEACAVARHGADAIAYCWLTWEPVWVEEVRRVLVPAPDEVYAYDAFTVPDWRGRALFPALLSRLHEFARAEGRSRAMVFALDRNVASRRAIEHAGFSLFGTVTRLDLWGLERLRFRGFTSRRSRPTLVLPSATAPRR
ncbi:MAG TPA: GNAT family N-acetyltransferase [Candidatus Binatia bacterium]|jgi:GNAT superfamily N-acetyltransferase|nr:GNAT family N-acetyltransferase [Candidatus Binatia bacterium]